MKSKFVTQNSKVTLNCNGATKTIVLVKSEDIDPAEGKISIESPLGKALLHRNWDETIFVQTPNGITKYRIINIK